jgi:large subunit ribosomal protein L32e
MHPSGYEEIRIFTLAELAGVNPEVQAVRIGGSVGNRKRGEIQARALELGLKVLNAKDLTPATVTAESEEEVKEDE